MLREGAGVRGEGVRACGAKGPRIQEAEGLVGQ